MKRDDLRSEGERELAERLGQDAEVKSAIAASADSKERGIRRQLLATALRVTPTMAPDIAKAVDECREILGVELSTEVYVFPSPSFNACVFRPENDRVFLAFSSSLVEGFEADELKWVIGHELGHHQFDHLKIPAATLLEGGHLSPAMTLQLFAWQRYAEISADRAGIVCSGAVEPAGRALFKLSSGLIGLRSGRVTFDADHYLAQAGDLHDAATDDRREGDKSEWFTTHPFSPLRLRAAQLFAASELFVAGGRPRAELEGDVQDLMQVMDPGYLKEKTDAGEAMRRLFFSAGIAIAGANGEVTKDEIAALERFLGAGVMPARVNVDAVKETLPRRIADVKAQVPVRRRSQMVRDLCVIAVADGHVDHAEEKVLLDLASELDVSSRIVQQALAGAARLD